MMYLLCMYVLCITTHERMHLLHSLCCFICIFLQVLVIQENDRELQFSMVDGDFKKFEGKWSVKSQER